NSLSSDTTTLTVVPGSPHHVTLTSSTADLAAGTTRTLTVEIRDAAGNLESGDNTTVVTFAKTSGTGTVTGLGPATSSGGVASQTVTGALAGTATITATANSLTADSSTFTVVAGQADHLTFTSSIADLASGNSRTLTVEVRDTADNLESGD